MTTQAIILHPQQELAEPIPSILYQAGEKATRCFFEFFTANIENDNTRKAYFRSAQRFLNWCGSRGLKLEQIEPMLVAAYLKQLQASAPTVKQNLAAIRMLFDWLVVGQVLPYNPAAPVRGPKHVVKSGKTPVLTATEARELLDSIDISNLAGLRDRALIGVMVYSFARVNAVVSMQVEDYYQNGKRWWIRLHEKGGKFHQVPAHHNAETYLDAYLEASGIVDQKKSPLFRQLGHSLIPSEQGMSRFDAFRMIRRRAKPLGMERICCHTFRATGITAFLENGGSLEAAQRIAAHESVRTTKLYDRRGDKTTLDEIERIVI